MLLGFYNIPVNYFGMHVESPAPDVVNRSYLMDGICGPGTTYACPGKDVPIPTRESAHVDPQGQLVEPGR
jgi:hypothetical protein